MSAFVPFNLIFRRFFQNTRHLRTLKRHFTDTKIVPISSAPLQDRITHHAASKQTSFSGSRLLSQNLQSDVSTKGKDSPQDIDPYILVKDSIDNIAHNIKQTLQYEQAGKVQDMAAYHFDGGGKSFRPLVILLTAQACNHHTHTNQGVLLPSQERVAEIAEMIHTASLVHDDVIDGSDVRRGKPSAQAMWGQKHAILSGVYILSVSSQQLAKLNNNEVVTVLAQVLEDLVKGEFMQLGTEEDQGERFEHYLTKTYKKTASLVANSCKAVAILSGADKEVQEIFFQYGRNVGLAFQLVDDLLDFVSNEAVMGKPCAADLKLGLATAPLLFASQEYPELDALVMRRFKQPGDVEHALRCVRKSTGLSQTRLLAEEYCKEALRQISQIEDSPSKQALHAVIHKVLNRLK